MKTTGILTRMGLLVALGVASAYIGAIPVLGAKLFPAQHAINVVAGAVLGPVYGGVVALAIALIRLSMGTGTLLAIPGSVFGVILAGLLYRQTRSKWGAIIGEVIGTGIIGALVAYPMAVLLLNNAKAAAAGITFFIIPFGSSSLAGALIGSQVLTVLERFLPVRPGQSAEVRP